MERCDLIRAIAAERFLARGYAGVSVDEIVKEAGGSKTNVYCHFGGKEGLFLAVAEMLGNEVLSPLASLDLAGLPLDEGLRQFAGTLLDILLQDRQVAFHRLVVAESGRLPETGKAWLSRCPRTTARLLVPFLAAHQQAGHLRADMDVEKAARIFQHMVKFDLVDRVILDAGPKPETAEIDGLIHEAVAFFLGAFAGRTTEAVSAEP